MFFYMRLMIIVYLYLLEVVFEEIKYCFSSMNHSKELTDTQTTLRNDLNIRMILQRIVIK